MTEMSALLEEGPLRDQEWDRVEHFIEVLELERRYVHPHVLAVPSPEPVDLDPVVDRPVGPLGPPKEDLLHSPIPSPLSSFLCPVRLRQGSQSLIPLLLVEIYRPISCFP